jgi:hypothetical protein
VYLLQATATFLARRWHHHYSPVDAAAAAAAHHLQPWYNDQILFAVGDCQNLQLAIVFKGQKNSIKIKINCRFSENADVLFIF